MVFVRKGKKQEWVEPFNEDILEDIRKTDKINLEMRRKSSGFDYPDSWAN